MPASLNEILEPLQRLQWLSEAGSGQPICLLPGRRNLVLQQLSGDSNKDRWLDLLRSSLGAPRAGWEVQTQEYQLHSLWLAILQGQAFELRQILERLASWNVEAPAQQLFSDDGWQTCVRQRGPGGANPPVARLSEPTQLALGSRLPRSIGWP